MKNRCGLKCGLVVVVVPLLVVGCVRSHRYSDVVYQPLPSTTTVVTPTSPAPAVRVYPEATAPVTVPVNPPVTTVPTGVSPSDVALADSIRSALQESPAAVGANNVQITVQDGVVTLSGTTPTEHQRTQLQDKIARMPGVDRVVNRLRLETR